MTYCNVGMLSILGSYALGNAAGVLQQELKNTQALDFRPSSASSTFSISETGAYDGGVGEYWIPGRQEYRASRPVPEDGADGVQLPFDLMFLPGRFVFSAPLCFTAFLVKGLLTHEQVSRHVPDRTSGLCGMLEEQNALPGRQGPCGHCQGAQPAVWL